MTRPQVWCGVCLLMLAAAALAIRLPRLDQRPLHGDEANQAVKAGILLETGEYRYDPQEHHGPSLYWLTLPLLWLQGRADFAETTETDYRLVPVVFGVGLVLLLWLVADGLGRGPAVLAGLFTAISPAFVFYSRYYIQETLLVFFALAAMAAGWRYVCSKKTVWAILCGGAVGLMHATKETWVISAAAAGAGLVLTWAWTRWREGPTPVVRDLLTARAGFGFLAAAGLAAVVLYSSFGRHPRGPLDSILAYATYWRRGSDAGIHSNPWYFYLELLLAFRPAKGFLWTEGLIVALAAIGGLASLSRRALPVPARGFCRFLTFYTATLTALYAAISYKTPWCLLNFFHGMILLAGVGGWFLLRLVWSPRHSFDRGRVPACGCGSESAGAQHSAPSPSAFCLRLAVAVLVTALLLAGGWHLARQCYWLNFRLAADRRNPYVYAHTSTDIKNLAGAFERLAEASPAGRDLVIHVVTPDNYWPLPWYLRQFRPEHIGYWDDAAAWARDAAKTPAPDAIVFTADIQPQVDPVLPAAYNRQMMFGLRPEVLVHVYVREDLWPAFVATRAKR
ncbi:MAG: TIGR03663 family protein [Candidatus Anammoximicrobium sp.]|nr:TIGR03663 family protein [Candidatus Anammoximicrobium sp.]